MGWNPTPIGTVINHVANLEVDLAMTEFLLRFRFGWSGRETFRGTSMPW